MWGLLEKMENYGWYRTSKFNKQEKSAAPWYSVTLFQLVTFFFFFLRKQDIQIENKNNEIWTHFVVNVMFARSRSNSRASMLVIE